MMALRTPVTATSAAGSSMQPLVLGCAALVRELRAVLARSGLADLVEVDVLPAPLHNRPEQIVPAIEDRLATVDVDRAVILAYADCGTGGRLDAFIEGSDRDIVRLPGAHCYELFAGSTEFARLHADEPGTFYLTDFLTAHFDALVWSGLGLDRHPTLRDVYFGNYERVVLLSQREDEALVAAANEIARRLDLTFVHVSTGLGQFAGPLEAAIRVRSG
jgi:Protein of unknown function (DUF1638)